MNKDRESEIERRRDEALLRALNTPPKPHKPHKPKSEKSTKKEKPAK